MEVTTAIRLTVAGVALGLCCVATRAQASPPVEGDRPGTTSAARIIPFPGLGLDVTRTKTVDARSGEVRVVWRDQLGRVWRYADLVQGERDARAAQPRLKLHADLRAEIDRDPRTVRNVIAWLACDTQRLDAYAAQAHATSDPPDGDARILEAIEKRIEDDLRDEMSRTTAPFAARLEAAGLRVRSVASTAPVVFFDATGPAVLSIAAMPEVDALYLETAARADADESSNATHRVARVHRHGVRGGALRVAVLEDNGISQACPYLTVDQWSDPFNIVPDQHVHATAGCLASRLPQRIGVAPDVTLFCANAASYSDSDLAVANGWAVTYGAQVINMSFAGTNPTGTLNYLDRYFDFQARYANDSYVAAAGNDGIGHHVSWPGWNVISVGSHSDGNTADWSDDAMSSFSNTGDSATGCRKPTLVAVGSDVDTLGLGPTWLADGLNGTSFSAPACSGTMADALMVNGWLAAYSPAALALVMATAWHNVEGVGRYSDLDGAGGMNTFAAYRCAATNSIAYGQLTAANFNSPAATYIRNIMLRGGDKTRIAIAWYSDGDSSYTTTALQTDLDLRVFAGQNQSAGVALASSSSFDDNFEIVEFTPPVTGWYSVNISAPTLLAGHEVYGLAYSQKTRDTSSFTLRARTVENSPLAGPTVGNGSYFMDFQAPGSPSASWFSVPSGTLGDGFPISPETWCPVAFDGVTSVFFNQIGIPGGIWSGYSGTLDAAGVGTTNQVSIPAIPGIAGLTIYHVGFTLAPGSPDGIKEISEVHAAKLWPAGVDHPLADDGSFQQVLPFPFRFFGVNYTSVFVNANGNLTFGVADASASQSPAALLAGRPRIAALWRDLDPSTAGAEGAPAIRVRVVAPADPEVVIEWTSVPRFGVTDANTFRVTLRPDNSIKIEYLDCGATDGIVGVAPGYGIAATAPIDLTLHGNGTWYAGPNEAYFESFTAANPLDLASTNGYWNEIRFVPYDALANNYHVYLDVTR